MKRERLRRWLLIIAALLFLGIAVGSLLLPHEMAASIGYELDGIDGLNEFRAVYVGMWFATAVLLLIAARQLHVPMLGDVGALLILGQTCGRILSIFIDGLPSGRVLPILILELVGGCAILFVRPSTRRTSSLRYL